MVSDPIGRRRLIALGGAAALTGFAMPLRAQESDGANATPAVSRNIGSFRTIQWRDHFDDLTHGAIVCDTASRALHYWSEDESVYLLHPCSVPRSEEYTRRGRTRVVLKRRNPVWVPTPSMREEDPSLPARVEAGPDNPMGTRAMNLGWQYYRIHGIDNPEKIGRPASSGCFGLFNDAAENLFELVEVGTQVVVI